jgi:hypothetical protein
MRWRAVFFAMPLFLACSTWTRTGRVVNEPCVHLGVRPALDGSGNYAATVQLSTDWPMQCVIRDAGVE